MNETHLHFQLIPITILYIATSYMKISLAFVKCEFLPLILAYHMLYLVSIFLINDKNQVMWNQNLKKYKEYITCVSKSSLGWPCVNSIYFHNIYIISNFLRKTIKLLYKNCCKFLLADIYKNIQLIRKQNW